MSALSHCPACGHCLRDAEALAERVATLRASLRADGHVVTPDGYVRVDALCALFGFTEKTYANQRSEGAGIPFIRRAGRPLYALADVVHEIDRQK